jgi:hypothetical protein
MMSFEDFDSIQTSCRVDNDYYDDDKDATKSSKKDWSSDSE